MVQQGYSLLRIIIIDSFWKGQVNELDLTGHTQLEGTNGAGKTSLMRLLPLFYGMRPSDIVSKVDQARNFADYYLPRDSSMLVYEYQRPHGQTCMVLASSDGRGVHFKFVDGAYNSDHFIGEDNKPYSVSEVDRCYRQMGCDRSSFLGIDKYRQVIQNLRSGRKLKDIRQLQNRYAFSELPCPHIEKVINGTIEKNLDFEAVKRMLVAIASDHLARNNVEEKEQISLNKEEITSWLADIQASRAVQKFADKIDLWQSDFATLDSLLMKLQHLHFEIIEHQVRLEEQQKACSKVKKDSQVKLSELQKQLEDAVTSLNQQIYDLQAKMSADQSHIDLLDDDKIIFDDDDAPNYQLYADKAPHIQNELNEVNAIIDAFEGDLAKVQQKFTDLIQKLEFQHVKDQADNEKKSADISVASSTQLGKVEAIYQQQSRELEEQISQKNLDLQLKEQNIEHELHSTKVAFNHVQLDSTLLQDIEHNRHALSDAKDKQNQLYQIQAQSQSLLSSLRHQRDKHLDRHQQENRQLEALKAEYTQVEAQLIPALGSLQHYLDNEPQASDWKHNIGRLLTSEQLTRCDLDPQWVGGDSFYGLALDLQQLQTNDSLFLDEIQLREKRDLITKNIQIQTDKIEQLDDHINQQSKEIATAELDCTREAHNLQRNELNLQQLNVQFENLAVKKQLAIKVYTEEVKVRLSSLENDKKDNVKQQQLFNDNCEEQRNELHNQVLEKRMVVESDRDTQLTLLSQEHIQLDVNYQQRLKALKKQRHADVAKLDPDGEVDKRVGERKHLVSGLQKCAEFEQKAHKYHHFMTNRYCHRNGLVEQNQNRMVQKRGVENQLEEVKVALMSEINTLRQLIKKYNLQKQATDDLLNHLNDSKNNCVKHGIEVQCTEGQPSNQADLSVSFCADWMRQFEVVEKRLSDQLNKFNERFRKDHAASELYENWQKLVAENDHYQAAKTLFKYREPIADLLSSAAQKQKSTYQLVSVNASMINEFYQHIENFGRRIKQIGKQLSSKVTALAHFEALADINVTTVMKQEELDYWGPLQQFAKVFELCRDQLQEGIGEIPDDLVYAMQKLSAYLPSEGFMLSHSNLFDIEFTITEKGQVKHARNARQLKKVSSTGLSYLAMLSLFTGILGMLRGESQYSSQIILPVDELGELAAENIALLLQMFADNHICILSASPSTDRHILALYERHYKLKDNKIYHAEIPQSRLDELLALRVSQKQTTIVAQELS